MRTILILGLSICMLGCTDVQNGGDDSIVETDTAQAVQEFKINFHTAIRLNQLERAENLLREFRSTGFDSTLCQQLNDTITLRIEKHEKLAQAWEKSLSRLKKKLDDFNGTTWYYQPYFTHYTNSNHISIYMGSKDGEWLRLMMSYYGDSWIFFEKAYLSYEGNTVEIAFNEYSDKKTENDGGYVWEWIDVSIDDQLIAYLESFCRSSDAKMRLTGKYHKDHKLSLSERNGIKAVLEGYKALRHKRSMDLSYRGN